MMDFEIIKKIVYVVRSNSKNILIVIVLFDGIIIESIKEDLKVFFEVDLNIDYVIIFMDVIRDVFLVVIYCIGEKKNLNFFFKKLREFREFVDILGIIMYDNLDLDLIVSVMVLVVIVQIFGFKIKIFYGGEIIYYENRVFINLFGIEFIKVLWGLYEIKRMFFFVFVDCQLNGNLIIFEEVDFERIKIVIDYYQVFQYLSELLFEDVFMDICLEVNLVFFIFVEYFRGMNYFLILVLVIVLFYGIYVDIKKFFKFSLVDLKVIEFFVGKVDYEIFDKIEYFDISIEIVEIFVRVILNCRMYKNVVISNVGFIKNRDVLVEVVDFFFRLEGIIIVLVFGIVEDYIEMLVRIWDVCVNIGKVMKEVFGEIGSGGGYVCVGGVRILFGFFKLVKDKNFFFRFVEEVIMEKFFEVLNIKEG